MSSDQQPMHTLTRRSALGLLAAATGGLLAACSSSTPPATTSVPAGAAKPATGAATAAPAPTAIRAPAGQQPVTLKYWHAWAGPRLPLVEQQIAGFQAKYPNLKVEHTLVSQQGMSEKYLTAIASGDPPDIIMVHGARDFTAFASNGVLTAVDDLLAAEKIAPKEVWFEPEYTTYVWEGKTYALPFATGTGFFVLFWNKDHFREAGLDPERAPKTWSELSDYGRKLTAKKGEGFDRIAFDPALGGATNNYIVREWAFLNNGQVMSADRKKVLFDSPEMRDALKWMVGYYDEQFGGFANVRSIVAGPGDAPFRQAFLSGKLSMFVDGVWTPALLAAQAPDLKYGMALVPYNDKNPKATTRNIVEGGWGYAIPKGSKQLREAWEFLKWTTMSEGGNLEFFKGQDRPSPVIKFSTDPYFTKTPYWNVVQEATAKSEYSPTVPVQSKLNEFTAQMVEEALLGKKTPEQAVSWAAGESQKALDQWWAQKR